VGAPQQPRPLQQGQVLADGGLAGGDLAGELADPHPPARVDHGDDPLPALLAEGVLPDGPRHVRRLLPAFAPGSEH
jgi:hypothetical protein